jgi:UDP-N-acetylmuramate--alanine ligase
MNYMERGNGQLFTKPCKVFMVGIKGTGMCALAEILVDRGYSVSGCDVKDRFYTDEILEKLPLTVHEGFQRMLADGDTDMVVYSAAYSREKTPVLRAFDEAGISMISYTEALGELSRLSVSAAVAGVHGKTTTTAIAGALAQAFSLDATVIVGSGVAGFNGRSTYSGGTAALIAETCEYKRHFLLYSPRFLLVTGIELDHQDYYQDFDDIFSAFVAFAQKLPLSGRLVFCADDPGASRLAEVMAKNRPDIVSIPYGFTADGPFAVVNQSYTGGKNCFRLEGYEADFHLKIPGIHTVLDAAGALALVLLLAGEQGKPAGTEDIQRGFDGFAGTRRRSEIIGEAAGILIMDDYGHHPTAVKTTLKGLRQAYPGRRIIVDFMSHTYSRTAALLDDFAQAFGSADMVILNRIYASAREEFSGTITGEDLYKQTCRYHEQVRYVPEPEDALPMLLDELKSGDLFVTMGAGDNFRLSHRLYKEIQEN